MKTIMKRLIFGSWLLACLCAGFILGRTIMGAALGVAFAQDVINPQTNAAALTTGTLPAGRLPALTGDVTSSVGSAATTLAAGSASNLNSGTLPAGRLPALTGEVTSSAGSAATTIAAVAWTTSAPTPTCAAGTPTTITTAASSRALGKSVVFTMTTTLTNIGSCTTALFLGTSFITTVRPCAVSAVNTTTLITKTAFFAVSTSTLQVTGAGLTFPGVNGDVITISGVCENT